MSQSDDPTSYEIEITISDFRRHFSDKIIANLCRGLAGIDRLASLAHLSKLNAELPVESPLRERNLSTIALMMFGTLYEMNRVLDHLNRAGIKGALRDPAPWDRLEEIRKRWTSDPARRLRSRVAFHLCYTTDDGIRGLVGLAARQDRVVFNRYFEGPELVNGRHPIGDEVLLTAAELSQTDLETIVERGPADGAEIAISLHEIARDLLRQCGAHV